MPALPSKQQVALAFGSDAPQTMSSLEIESLTGSRHDKVKQSIERLAAKGVIVQPPTGIEQAPDSMGRMRATEVYLFGGDQGRRDSIIVVAQLCPEFTARIVDRWQELEAKVAKPAALSRMDILKLAMESEEARIKAEAERDHAIATKAQIGSRREAKAMATASAKAREVKRLEHELGYSQHHATILQVESKLGLEFDFHPLRRWCNKNHVKPDTVPDKRYPGGVKAWPAAAWMDVYGVDLGALFAKEGV